MIFLFGDIFIFLSIWNKGKALASSFAQASWKHSSFSWLAIYRSYDTNEGNEGDEGHEGDESNEGDEGDESNEIDEEGRWGGGTRNEGHEGDESDEGHEGDEGHEVKDLRMALRAPLGSLYSSEIAMGGVCAGP